MPQQNDEFDIVVVGAGPAGLSSAIFSARRGKKVIIIEKGNKVGPEPRGETLHDSPILAELLGKGFIESISLSKTDIREFYAPDPIKMIKITRKTPSIVFNWEKFIEGFKLNLDDSNITLRLNSEVKELIISDKQQVKGVIFEDKEGKKTKIFGKVVFGCDGFRSVIGKSLNIDYKEINFPIIKCLMKKGNYETNGFKYFFVPSGSLEYAQKFPPLIIFIFPRDEKNFETGIIIQTDNANQLGLTMPPSSEIMRVWVKLKDNYPLFSKMIKGSSIIYEKLTAIPMTGVIKNIIPKPGVVLLGDAAGFVEVSGGSGLVSSIKMAKIWSDLICNAIDNEEENLSIWTDENVNFFKKTFEKSDINKHIKKVAKLYNYFRKILFVKMGSKEKIMKNWGQIRFLMKHA